MKLNSVNMRLLRSWLPGYIHLQDKTLNHLFYADDLLSVCEYPTGLQRCLDSLQNDCGDWRLAVNFTKTKVIIFSKKAIEKHLHYFYYEPNSVEIVDSYKYLGIIFHFSGKFKASVSNLADKVFALKAKLPCNNNLSATSWLKLYNSMVVPILTYGSEVWITEFKPNFEALDKT